MFIVAAAIAAAAIIWLFATRVSSAASDQDEFQPISRAVFADEQLWMLHDDGLLVALKPDAARPERVQVDGKILEICRSMGDLLAAVRTDERHWAIQRRLKGRWNAEASLSTENDRFIALGCAPDSATVTLITDRRLFKIDGGEVRPVQLAPKLEPPFAIGTALTHGGAVWLGFNVGEWGGGLRRIALNSGRVQIVESNRSGELCGGPLNTECDPVNAIVASPLHTGCVIAAIGLVHFMSHGRIVEVCGTDVRRTYFKALDPQPRNSDLDDGEPSSTTAFFGLERSKNTLWAIGIDGLYRFHGAAAPRFTPLPKFENRGGYRISFEVPGIVLVMSGVNQRRSLSGMVPIATPR